MRVVVGRLGRAHGIRGELTVEVRTDEPEERFAPGSVLLCSERTGVPASVTVAAARWQGGRLVVRLEGIDDRAAAEALRGTILEADVEPVAGEDEEYHDLVLVGLQVRDGAGAVLGTVTEVLHLPSQDLLAVKRTAAPELLVPFVTAIVPEVSVSKGFLVVDLPTALAGLAADGAAQSNAQVGSSGEDE